ncbi:four helix bundle protein [Aurantibacillus circumpalustris]|uniref:four helix bundle protein n=1 Tax=Aurantibacillus circumpalustris TaxID=3036359 RepID=UPI00295A9260|nr:four helix bundle protein [Aurantibacillus circumpalustris]
MATITKFEDIEIWQLARKLNKEMYPFLQSLIDTRNYELNKQMERASGSIMDNVAEGFERDGTREFIQFLAISKGSAGEIRSQLYRALDRNLITEDQFNKFQIDCKLIGDKIGKFMNYLNNSNIKGKKFTTTTQK